ncbi:cyclic nucleotide-gated ion channel 1 [Artemisia annua]|uniref:Cyclic nucleotide-gated ion channel 1 n=1 Tax=Artemisia annua TaxID=35608 RepID=A0A2U1MAL8_ARTAN|nr:cyclic nucleotide-gated ion channel 1 [Artemisia annua]
MKYGRRKKQIQKQIKKSGSLTKSLPSEWMLFLSPRNFSNVRLFKLVLQTSSFAHIYVYIGIVDMNHKQEKYVRFRDIASPEQSYGYDQRTPTPYGLYEMKIKPSFSSIMNTARRGLTHAYTRVGIMSNVSLVFQQSTDKKSATQVVAKKKMLDPQGSFLQKWNKIFIILSLIAVTLDPLFFYIPVIDRKENCIGMDNNMKIISCVLRTLIDLVYILHIVFEFRTGFISPSSRVFGRGELIEDSYAIAKRYICSYLFMDIYSILPIPQVALLFIIPMSKRPASFITKDFLKSVILAQYIPRLLRIIPLYREVTRASGIFTETPWAGAAFNLFLYMLASHVIGSFWYLLSIDREDECWREACRKMKRDTSSIGQNLTTSTYGWEILFAIIISIVGLVLFTFLIGNMQKYLQSMGTRVEEMRVKRRDTELWMSHRMLPDELKQRVRRYEQYKWQENRGVDEEYLIHDLPKDLRRDIKRHLCLNLLMRVPMFKIMDERLLDAMSECLKPVLYTENSYIVREGDPVDEMLFIMRGELVTTTTNGGRSDFFNSSNLKAGDFCGDELLTWALDPSLSSSFPLSTRTVRPITDVEAFSFKADDFKAVASQFRRLHSKRLRHTFRYHSQQWRTWGACFIQAAWRRHQRRKHEAALLEEEKRLHDALAKGGETSSPSLGATIYASRFASNMLHKMKRNRSHTPRLLPQSVLPQKPVDPDFSADEDQE